MCLYSVYTCTQNIIHTHLYEMAFIPFYSCVLPQCDGCTVVYSVSLLTVDVRLLIGALMMTAWCTKSSFSACYCVFGMVS